MDKEFHYYITYAVAQRAGFGPDDAYRIAYASQHTDDNTTKYVINDGLEDRFESYVSQTFNITQPQGALLRIYPVFHFVPGSGCELFSDGARRRDGKLHLLNAIPNGENSRNLLAAALDSGSPYRIGIAAHAFADAFAHQNFTGSFDAFNSFSPFSPVNICHVEALHRPDWTAAVWHDGRLVSGHERVDNRKRVLQAAAFLLKMLSRGTASAGQTEELLKDLGAAIGERDDANEMADERRGRYIQLINGFRDYVEDAWFGAAVSESGTGSGRANFDDTRPPEDERWMWKPGYKQSDWYLFQCAVKEHQRLAMDTVLKPILSSMETVM